MVYIFFSDIAFEPSEVSETGECLDIGRYRIKPSLYYIRILLLGLYTTLYYLAYSCGDFPQLYTANVYLCSDFTLPCFVIALYCIILSVYTNAETLRYLKLSLHTYVVS